VVVFALNGTAKLAPLGRYGEVPVTTTPEFTAKYKTWLESLGPESSLLGAEQAGWATLARRTTT
jgi:hypothetical protein